MQYVNDDMDDLFRKAAEGYPLDTKGSDWNKVLAALQDQAETGPEKKGNRNRRFLWLLLLLPLGIICNQLYSPSNLNEEEISGTDIEENLPPQTITEQEHNFIRKADGINAASNPGGNNIVIPGRDSEKNSDARNENVNLSSSQLQTPKNSVLPKHGQSKSRGFNVAGNDVFSSGLKQNQSNASNNWFDEEPFSYRNYVSGIAVPGKLPFEISTSVSRSMNPLFQAPKEEQSQIVQLTRRKKLYAGLMGGIDATTVKFQKIENTGFSYGLLLGYQVNKKWSIETGAFLERKYYYSEGKYFNTSKMSLPPNTWLSEASGDCKMIEVPLMVKYNFSTRKNSDWFAGFGASSYIMRKENYSYNYYYGTSGPVLHKKQYKNASTNIFSALSISGGYSHHLGNIGDVRIEPYVKLPVSGMGIGKLPFLSTGLQVGITRKF